MDRISNHDARNVILHLQGLSSSPDRKLAEGELREIIFQLGFVQMDSIRWVERAHHMILLARNQTYRTENLKDLHEKHAVLFENWTHDASLIPVEFWKYWKHKFRRDTPRLDDKFTRWQGAGFRGQIDKVLELIAKSDGLRSRDMEKPKNVKMDMWQWHDGKAALEYLWRTGQIAVSARDGFQKVYDLTERTIASEFRAEEVSENEFVDWACRSAIEKLGFGSAGDIARFWDLLSIREVSDWLAGRGKSMVKQVEILSPNGEAKKLIARRDIFEIIKSLSPPPSRMRILSPFDPVLRDRKRLSWLFDFDYTIEIYVPEKKRKYGYYVFPILEGNQVIGRVDCQARSKEDCLHVSKLWLEPKVKWTSGRETKFVAELKRQSRLASVSKINWNKDRVIPF